MKVLPSFGRLDTSTVPPRIDVSSLTKLKPSPTPLYPRVTEEST